jgi:hypothetical protein
MKKEKIRFIPCTNDTMVWQDIARAKKKKKKKQWSSKTHKNLNGK